MKKLLFTTFFLLLILQVQAQKIKSIKPDRVRIGSNIDIDIVTKENGNFFSSSNPTGFIFKHTTEDYSFTLIDTGFNYKCFRLFDYRTDDFQNCYKAGEDKWMKDSTFTVSGVPNNALTGVYDIIMTYGSVDFLSGFVGLLPIEDTTFSAFYLAPSSISGKVYFDKNQNGVKDSTEVYVSNRKVITNPGGHTAYTRKDGSYVIGLENGSYTITVDTSDGVQVTSAPNIHEVTVAGTEITNKDFGIYSFSNPIKFSLNYYLDFIRCNSTVTRNEIEIANGSWADFNDSVKVVLISDSVATATSNSESQVNVLFQDGDSIVWAFHSLNAYNTKSVYFNLVVPGVQTPPLILQYKLYYKQDGVWKAASDKKSYSTIRCAYDPNDKLVQPARGQGKNYTLFSEDFEYTIRFQNTGNDTAFTVEIKDTLSDLLDYSTFELINSSHTAVTSINTDAGIVSFLFENILLPDSNVNEQGSHGYVKFSIKPISALAENSEIINKAAIYFDLNPPIITNEVVNTMVSQLPVGLSKSLNMTAVKIYPNPVNRSFTVDCEKDFTGTITLYSLQGVELMQSKLQGKTTISSINIAPGTYIYKILSDVEGASQSGILIKN